MRPRLPAELLLTATSDQLAGIRVWVCLTAFLVVAREDLPSFAWLPVAIRKSMGLMDFLYAHVPGLWQMVASPESLARFQHGLLVLLALGIVGLATRMTLPLAALAYGLKQGLVSQSCHLLRPGILALYLLIILSFTPCADSLSVDWLLRRWWSQRRGTALNDGSLASTRYGWARLACWTLIAMTYLEAGLSKLRRGGIHWFAADNLRSIFYNSWLSPMSFPSHDAHAFAPPHIPDLLLSISGVLVVAFELLFVTVLVSRRARFVFPLLALFFHGAVYLLQGLVFVDSVLLQLLIFDPRGLNARSSVVKDAAPQSGSSWRALIGPGIVAAALMTTWIADIESFPISRWGMFADLAPVPTLYVKISAVRRNGSTFEPVIPRAFPILHDGRAVDMLWSAFGRPSRMKGVDLFYDRLGCRLAETDGELIDKIVVERWRWDFREEPAAYSVLDATYTHDLDLAGCLAVERLKTPL